ncbi:TPA: metalloendopeptidase [Proteus mirabilis]|nr:metalloendopeptidase [Proteus mirabilis]HAU5533014.1 metalloendopeptidase [Proteus mirabilis]HAU5536553.1 metalloendopeptidase [Proteus mirabilis]HAU5540470.1 metalloendopeptidase [Proteus mirabilis]HAU5571028.1 metalloendopeptidase [Proteus mirabilis]
MHKYEQNPILLLSQTLNDTVPYVSPSSHNKDNILFISNS